LPKSEVEQDEANDPLLHSVRLLRDAGALSVERALKMYNQTQKRVFTLSHEAVKRPRLSSACQIMESIIPPVRGCKPSNGVDTDARSIAFGNELKTQTLPQTMGKLINWALIDLMLDHPEVVMMGEDVGLKGGVYGVTQKIQKRFGPARVIDSLLDEQSILGLAIGMGHNGFIPIPEIQFLAYLHNAEDQLRGEAATLSFFSNGQFTNPMVLRVAGLGYQKGFGGHFHNDNSLAVLRDIPGVIIACPSSGAEAARMLRESVRLAREEQRVVVFVEPIALYHTRDLEDGDGSWMDTYPSPEKRIGLGEVGIHGNGLDLAIVTYGNGHYLSRQAVNVLENEGIKTRVIDLRWLAPLPHEALFRALDGCKNVLIVDECRGTGGQAEGLMALFAEAEVGNFARLVAEDSFITTGPAYGATMPSKDSIIDAAHKLIERVEK
jgi:2-oxoisovalerate dehydrogenase E1 component